MSGINLDFLENQICDPNILSVPEWIDWDCLHYPLNPGNASPSYRKITNLHGGSRNIGSGLEWLSYFNTVPGKKKTVVTSPVYEKDPKYLWFLDKVNKKLKISENDQNTLAIKNPIQECKNKDCCSTSSNVKDNGSGKNNCVYHWHSPDESFFKEDDGYCEDAGSGFTGPYKYSSDEWHYLENPDLFFNYVNPSGKASQQNISGTFCIKTEDESESGGKGLYMRTFLGCDCMAEKIGSIFDSHCSNFHHPYHSDICTSENIYDDSQIADAVDPEAARAEFQFIDEAAAAACCSLTLDEANGYDQCAYAFKPEAGSSKCVALMQDFCKNNWGDANNVDNKGTDLGNTCNRFLLDSQSNVKTIQETIQNYITDPSRTPQDYISKKLAEVGHIPSVNFYNSCDNLTIITPGATDGENDLLDYLPDECSRDDSTDDFFKSVMPYLCNLGSENYGNIVANPNEMKSVCDGQLNYFCAQFTREELSADVTLQRLCGCHLIGQHNTYPPPTQTVNDKTMELTGEPQKTSPYYTGLPDGDNCDVICTTATIKNVGGRCTTPTCIIDSVSINLYESGIDNASVTQDCDESRCYIGNVDVDIVNSSVRGSVFVKQNCGTCWKFKDDIKKAEKVNCGTLEPSVRTVDEDEIKDEIKDENKDENNWTKYIIYIVIIFIVLCILGFGVFYFLKKE